MFLSANASKRSLACSLRDPRGREAVLRLADGADVFLQSLRPGLAERLGLGAEALRGRNPRLVYCSVGAYGQRRAAAGGAGLRRADAGGGRADLDDGRAGPARRARRLVADRPGHRHVGRARDPRRAARARARPARAAWSTSRSTRRRSATSATTSPAISPTARCRAGEGTRFPTVAPYQVLPTRDGELMVAAGNDRLFALLCGELGAHELARRSALPHQPRPRREPRRAGRAARAVLRRGRHRLVARAAHARRRAGAPVADVADVLASPQTEALGIAAEPPPPGDPGPPAAGAAALARRRPRRAPQPAAAPRRAHRRDPARGRLRATPRSPSSSRMPSSRVPTS